MSVPQGEFVLDRNPPDEFLQAWDAADEYLLKQVDEPGILFRDTSILVVNDSFGALTVALSDYAPLMMSDSYLAQQGLINNLRINGFPQDAAGFSNGLQIPRFEFDLVLIKIPKTLALLEHQLYSLRGLIRTGSRIIGAGMTRSIHKSTIKLFEHILGPTPAPVGHNKGRHTSVGDDTTMRATIT